MRGIMMARRLLQQSRHISSDPPSRRMSTLLSQINGKHLAAGTQHPKTDPDKITFYNMRFCPYAQRSALVLLAKNIPFENINIHLKNKPDWFVVKNPISGKVPVIEDGNATIRESIVICDYLDEKYPNQRRLSRPTPEGRARDKEMVEISKKIYGPMHNSVHAKTSEDFDKLKFALKSGLSDFDNELVSRGTDYFGGQEQPGMLDYVVWPWFERMGAFPLIDDLSEYPALNSWVDRMHRDRAVAQYALSTEDHTAFWAGFVQKQQNYDLIYERYRAKM